MASYQPIQLVIALRHYGLLEAKIYGLDCIAAMQEKRVIPGNWQLALKINMNAIADERGPQVMQRFRAVPARCIRGEYPARSF
ncbi:MAG: hypothetical protein ABI619_08075 [Betaproteobacteria bacterium]